ncbi:Holliday junction branch migration protein RuvA [Sedimentibacter sp. MB31-C6]|uniref:Holliday junction branch migration protein RuvA n=1 Tax=Sedimentibacter sp. MB31-C6 TaxID=3109366 RepID=UPI002DDCAFF1|nr:Holliday junction branch migration protein RuvA [Sedimentibacter sp. MB36-C1]WSI04487.1 Holliday junction branch migration protein RuvA [Sedimentibacter sp. MB36-C1]
MISFIKGEVIKKGLDYLVIENNNIGYFISTSLSTLKMLNEGDNVCIYTYLHIREDILALYGFLKSEELEMFKKLILVNGIGPKAGLSVLSTYNINTIKEIILKDDTVKMSKVPGIGKKTASKIILELKDKVGTLEGITSDDKIDEISIQSNSETSDVLNALISLGFNQFEAKKTLDNMDLTGKSENDIIKEALKNINR